MDAKISCEKIFSQSPKDQQREKKSDSVIGENWHNIRKMVELIW